MAKSDDMERRLENWARWRQGAGLGGLGYASSNMLAAMGGDRGGYREATVPTVDCEGAETDRAVMTLASELRATVEVYYLQPWSMAEKARRLAVTEATVRNRLGRAHGLLSSWLADQAQQRRAERARVQALQ